MHQFAYFNINFDYKNSKFGNQIAHCFCWITHNLANDSENNKIDRDEFFSMNPEQTSNPFS